MGSKCLGCFYIFITLHSVLCAPCDITSGRNAVILDITESIGQGFDQKPQPGELPLEGDLSQVDLKLSDEGKRYFLLEGKTLSLVGPLDRDAEELSTIRFEIVCNVRSSSQMRNVPVIVRVRDRNDNAPAFIDHPYTVVIREDAAVGSAVFRGILAEDSDFGINGQVVYKVTNVTPSPPSSVQLFDINLPYQGVVFLNSPLDYEAASSYKVDILVTDSAANENDRLSATTSLTIHVEDVDDQDPIFTTADPDAVPCSDPGCGNPTEYLSSIVEGEIAGVLDIYPGRIYAKDPDSIAAPVTYRFIRGHPTSFNEYFEIDPRSAVVTQIRRVDRSQISFLDLVIQAEEDSVRRGSSIARLRIDVQRVDSSPPRLITSSYSGIVQEAALPGTPVLRDDGTGEPFTLTVLDVDYRSGEELPKYSFELTSPAFEVNSEGVLVVASPNLNRDDPSPSTHTFQAIARENVKGGAASAPVTLRVSLQDINDNAPRLPVYPAITVPAGPGRRKMIQVRAIDVDEGDNARVTYSLANFRNKFTINSNTGVILATEELLAGDLYQLRVTATDGGGLTGEGVVEVIVSKGPNTNGPVFQRSRYTASVFEDAASGTKITTLKAVDSEGDVPYYSIIGGDAGDAFKIDTLSGVVSVVAPLDREIKNNYELVIRAADNGEKSNTATVSVKVLDVNDEAPQFKGLPFSFRVDEGLSDGKLGVVKAEDEDLGVSGRVSYLLEGDDRIFKIDPTTGEISTRVALDYEEQKVHYLPVVAKDRADDPLSSTATVTVLVNDLSDELPTFLKEEHEITIPENSAIGTLVTTLQAQDLDTVPMITYLMVEGDSGDFRIAPDTGRVTVTSNLDFERREAYVLIIGTKENTAQSKGWRTRLKIQLEDLNDEEPSISPLSAVTLPKMAPVGSLLAKASASDADGTSPNNKIEFSISGISATAHFGIGPETGEIRLKTSLKDAPFNELMVTVAAADGGDPPHSTFTQFKVLLLDGVQDYFDESFNEVSAAPTGGASSKGPLASSPKFSKDHFQILVNEDIGVGNVVLKVPLINTTSAIDCSIMSDNIDILFGTSVTVEGNCDVQIIKELDYEIQSAYNVTLVLHPTGSNDLILSKALVEIHLADVNDNTPMFLLKDFAIPQGLQKDSILAFALQESPIGTKVIEIKALDFDSRGQSKITYELLPESNRGNYFSVDSSRGRISTQRGLLNVPMELKPFNLTVVAKDQKGINGVQHASILHIVIPIIEASHRSVLLFDSPVENIESEIANLTKAISMYSGKPAQIEDLVRDRRRRVGTNKKELVPMTQLWFHLLEPTSWKPLPADFIYEERRKKQLMEDLSSPSSHLRVKPIRLVSPGELRQDSAKITEDKTKDSEHSGGGPFASIVRISTLESLGAMEYVLLILACFIIFFVLCAIIAICILWSRFSKRWSDADKTVMLFPPATVIEAPPSVIDVSKEYEIQVLHMSVPLDDDSLGEAPLESDSPQNFFLDNVSYISKSQTGLDGSSSGGPGSSGQGTPRHPGRNDWPPEDQVPRSSYDPYGGDGTLYEPDPLNALSASASNENVMFGRREYPDPSPVETTTEL